MGLRSRLKNKIKGTLEGVGALAKVIHDEANHPGRPQPHMAARNPLWGGGEVERADKPTSEEKENCEVFLNKEFEMLKNIKVILGLGKIGFDSYLKYVRKKYPIKMKDYKFGHGVRYEMPNKLILFGAFHPSPRNVNTGRLNFEMMVEFLKRIKSELK